MANKYSSALEKAQKLVEEQDQRMQMRNSPAFALTKSPYSSAFEKIGALPQTTATGSSAGNSNFMTPDQAPVTNSLIPVPSSNPALNSLIAGQQIEEARRRAEEEQARQEAHRQAISQAMNTGFLSKVKGNQQNQQPVMPEIPAAPATSGVSDPLQKIIDLVSGNTANADTRNPALPEVTVNRGVAPDDWSRGIRQYTDANGNIVRDANGNAYAVDKLRQDSNTARKNVSQTGIGWLDNILDTLNYSAQKAGAGLENEIDNLFASLDAGVAGAGRLVNPNRRVQWQSYNPTQIEEPIKPLSGKAFRQAENANASSLDQSGADGLYNNKVGALNEKYGKVAENPFVQGVAGLDEAIARQLPYIAAGQIASSAALGGALSQGFANGLTGAEAMREAIASARAVGNTASAVSRALSSYSRAYKEGRADGADSIQALQYANQEAINQGIGEFLLGGIGGMGEGMLGKVAANTKVGRSLAKAIGTHITSPLLKTAIRYAGTLGGEAIEEMIQDVVTVANKRATYKPDAKISGKELVYSGVLGAAMAGVFNAPGLPATYQAYKADYDTINNLSKAAASASSFEDVQAVRRMCDLIIDECETSLGEKNISSFGTTAAKNETDLDLRMRYEYLRDGAQQIRDILGTDSTAIIEGNTKFDEDVSFATDAPVDNIVEETANIVVDVADTLEPGADVIRGTIDRVNEEIQDITQTEEDIRQMSEEEFAEWFYNSRFKNIFPGIAEAVHGSTERLLAAPRTYENDTSVVTDNETAENIVRQDIAAQMRAMLDELKTRKEVLNQINATLRNNKEDVKEGVTDILTSSGDGDTIETTNPDIQADGKSLMPETADKPVPSSGNTRFDVLRSPYEHTQTHKQFDLLQTPKGLSDEDFNAFKKAVKDNGGWFSKYAKGWLVPEGKWDGVQKALEDLNIGIRTEGTESSSAQTETPQNTTPAEGERAPEFVVGEPSESAETETITADRPDIPQFEVGGNTDIVSGTETGIQGEAEPTVNGTNQGGSTETETGAETTTTRTPDENATADVEKAPGKKTEVSSPESPEDREAEKSTPKWTPDSKEKLTDENFPYKVGDTFKRPNSGAECKIESFGGGMIALDFGNYIPLTMEYSSFATQLRNGQLIESKISRTDDSAESAEAEEDNYNDLLKSNEAEQETTNAENTSVKETETKPKDREPVAPTPKATTKKNADSAYDVLSDKLMMSKSVVSGDFVFEITDDDHGRYMGEIRRNREFSDDEYPVFNARDTLYRQYYNNATRADVVLDLVRVAENNKLLDVPETTAEPESEYAVGEVVKVGDEYYEVISIEDGEPQFAPYTSEETAEAEESAEPEEEDSSSYQVGEEVEYNGKNYRILRFNDDGSPVLQEIKQSKSKGFSNVRFALEEPEIITLSLSDFRNAIKNNQIKKVGSSGTRQSTSSPRSTASTTTRTETPKTSSTPNQGTAKLSLADLMKKAGTGTTIQKVTDKSKLGGIINGKRAGTAESGNRGKSGSGRSELGAESQRRDGGRTSDTVQKTEKEGESETVSEPSRKVGGRNGTAQSGTTDRNGNAGESVQDKEPVSTGESNTGSDERDNGERNGGRATGNDDSSVRRRASCLNKNNYSFDAEDIQYIDNTRPNENDNLEAIRTLLTIEREGRQATPEERKILSKYKGWGGLSNIFDERNSWRSNAQALKSLLSPQEYSDARGSTQNAHYTSLAIVSAMYDGLKRMGLKGGNILEPSMGTGNFLGAMPKTIANNSNLFGVEMDSITGRIAKLLYPDADISISPFQDVKYKDNQFDVIVGNVPFSKNRFTYKGEKHSLHTYFFAKGLDHLKPGGIMMAITSTGTLDTDPKSRNILANKADLIAAFRLPGGMFGTNAGTQVTTDLLVFRKRPDGLAQSNETFSEVGPVQIEDSKTGEIKTGYVNEYFIRHPENVLGKYVDNTMYGHKEGNDVGSSVAVAPIKGEDYKKVLSDAMKRLPKDIIGTDMTAAEVKVENDSIKPGFIEHDGKMYFRDPSENTLEELTGKRAAMAKDYLKIKDAYNGLIELSNNPTTPHNKLEQARKTLNTVYDAFVNHKWKNSKGEITTFGPLNKGGAGNARSLLSADADYSMVSALEVKGDEPGTYKKAPIFYTDVFAKPPVEHVDSPNDALASSLAEKGGVDLAYMEKLTGLTQDQLLEQLQDRIVETPDGEYQLAELYLSGDVRDKLETARRAAETDEKFQKNVEMLSAVTPATVPPENISVTIGASWIPASYYQQFIAERLHAYPSAKIGYNNETGQWIVEGGKNAFPYSVAYGDTNLAKLLESTMNQKQMQIRDQNGKLDYEATQDAQEKQKQLRTEFAAWIFATKERKGELGELYNKQFNSWRNADYTELGQTLKFDGVNPLIKLRNYQRTAIARVVYGGNTLLGHGVGTGKTFEMIASAMECKRLGITHKNLLVVPKNKVADFQRDILKLYPNARVMRVTDQDFELSNRKRMISALATNDYDIAVIGHTQFNKIPLSKETQQAVILEQLNDARAVLADLKKPENGDGRAFSRSVKDIEKTIAGYEEKLKSLSGKEKDDTVTFENLGIDGLFVDEAHNFKNLPFFTTKNVAGVKGGTAQRATDMYMKTSWLHNKHAKVVFATATPITNTMAEIYNMTRFVSPETLINAGVKSFDAWSSVFGETVNALEVSPDGKNFRMKERFAKFRNAQQMISMFRQFSDILKTADVVEDLPKEDRITVTSGENYITKEYVDNIVQRMERMKGRATKEDNMLLITNDGKAAATDLRLVAKQLNGQTDPDKIYLPGFEKYTMADLDLPDSKINNAVKNVLKEYKDTEKIKGTQLIFLDQGLTSDDEARYGFDLYTDIINKLIKGGIKPEEIVRIDKVPIKKLEDLFDKMRSGEVRVLIGTTMRMGEGLNIQDRIVAMHELTPPAKPSGIEQSEGRAIRSGNMNKNVRIYRYIQEGSFDSYLWQQLERKGRFINVAMSGGAVNEIDDVDDAVLSYQEAKAIATGNPLLLEKAELDQKFNELESSYRWYMTQQISAQDTMANAPQALASAQKLLDARKADQETVNNNPVKDNKFSMTIEGKEYTERKTANEAIAKIFSNGKYALNHTYDIGSARGLTVQFLAQPGSFTLSVASKDFYTIPDAHADGDNATRIWNQLDKVESGQYVEPVENRIKKIQADIDEAKGILAKPYEHQQEYNDTLSRLHDVNIQLAAAAGNVTTEIIDEESDDFKGKFKTEEEKYEDELAEAEESADEEEGEDEATTPKRSSNRRNKVRKSLFKGRWGNGKHDKNAEIRSVNDLVDEAQRIFGIPINLGKMNAPRNARAIFKEFPETIRTRQYGDLSNIFHEVGHWFDKKYDLSTSPYVSTLTKEYEADLKQRGYEDEEITGESVAEYFREYLSNREETEDKFPKFTQWMYKQLNTRDNKGLLEYSGMTNAYFSADLERRADAQVHYRTDEDTILGNAQVVAEYLKEDPHGYLGGKGRDFMRAWFDDIHDLRGIARAYDLAFLARRANGIAAARLKYHMTDLNGNIVGPSLATILSDGQITDKATRKEFDKYLIARRALDHFMANTLGENLPTLVYADEELNNPDVLMDRIRRYDDMYPSFREASERLYVLQNQMLDLAIEAGIMPTRGDMTMEDMKQRLNELYPHYVPLYRKMDDPQAKAVAGSKYGSKNSPIAHFKGSGRDIYSPIENIMINMAKYTSLSLVAQVKRNIYDFVTQNEGMGMIAEEVPASKILDRVSTDEIKKKLDALGKDVEALSYLSEDAKKDVLDTITEVIGDTTGQWKIKTKQGTNIMPVMVDGKVHYLEIHDEGLMKTLENLEPKQFNLLTRFMGSFTRFKKLFATGINAKFAATNVARDLNTGFVSSSTTNNPIKYGADFIKEFISTLMEDERFQYFQLQGGGYMGAYTHDYDLLRKLNEEVMNNAPNIKKVFRAITGIMMKLIESGENASRQAEFYRAVNKGFDNLDAFRMSQEVTVNFDRGGSYVKGINQYVPYRQAAFNAFYHTADLFASGGRGGRGGNGGGNNTNDSVSRNRRNAITKWIMLGIASALLTALLSYLIANKIKGESKEKILEEREKLSKYRKMNYWNIYIGDGKFLELRKETMLNAPLNTIERLVDYYVLDQGDALDGLAGDLVDAILPVDVLHPISDIVGGTSGLGTIYNLARNKDFKDTPIEPEWMERQNIPYRDRYSDTTSEVWKKLGEILNQSPIKMQYAIEDNFAFWGQTFDRATSKSGDVWAGFNNSFIADNVYSTDIINTFYNQKEKYDSPKKGEDELETDYGSWKYQQIAGMYSDLNKFYKNENDSDYARMMRSTTNNLILQVNRAGMTDLDKAVIETIRGNTTEIKDVCPYITPPDHYTEQKVQFDMGYEDKVTYYLQEQEMFKEGYAQILQSGYDNATTSAMLVAYHKEVNKQLDAYWKQLLIDRAVNGQ